MINRVLGRPIAFFGAVDPADTARGCPVRESLRRMCLDDREKKVDRYGDAHVY